MRSLARTGSVAIDVFKLPSAADHFALWRDGYYVAITNCCDGCHRPPNGAEQRINVRVNPTFGKIKSESRRGDQRIAKNS